MFPPHPSVPSMLPARVTHALPGSHQGDVRAAGLWLLIQAFTLTASPGAAAAHTHLPIGPSVVFKLWLLGLASYCSRECAVSALLP